MIPPKIRIHIVKFWGTRLRVVFLTKKRPVYHAAYYFQNQNKNFQNLEGGKMTMEEGTTMRNTVYKL